MKEWHSINSKVEEIEGDSLTEKLALVDYSGFVSQVAEAYLARPKIEMEHQASWTSLMNHCKKIFRQIESKIEVRFVDEDPYLDLDTMIADVKQNGVMKIWTGASDGHPHWSAHENTIFRAVHDWYSHILGAKSGGHKFNLRGELNSYNRHIKIAPPDSHVALFTEIVGQVCTFNVKKSFNFPQKACKLWGFDYKNIGLVDLAEYQKNFE